MDKESIIDKIVNNNEFSRAKIGVKIAKSKNLV